MNFQTTLTQIKRSPFQAIAAIMIMTLTFVVISVFALLSYSSVKILQYFESAPQVIGFFKPGEDLAENQIANIKAQLEKSGKIASFRYVSTREAEAIYKEKNKDNPLLLELVDYKILPASIEISATDLKDLAALRDILQTQEGIDEVVYYEDVISSLDKWISSIKKLGLALTLYLTIESILIILVITVMRIAARREEIDILRLIGATSWFIKKPFIIEGIIYGLLGSFLAWGISYILLLYSTPFLANWLQDIPLLPLSLWFMLALLGGELVLGLIIGASGSLIASNRFLKE